jgi:hypothetical protein
MKEPNMVDSVDSDVQGSAIPLRFDVPDSIETRYATNFTAQHTEQEFIIGFYEARPPILLGTPEQNLAALRELGSVSARCVARVVVSPSRMRELIQVLTTNYENFLSRRTEGEEP